MISFSPPDISQEEIDGVVEVLKSGWITTGPKTKLFEKQLSQFCGTGKVCCLGSATASLELAFRVLGIGAGDEVITCAYTYTASCSAIIHVGATPVLVDVEPGSFHLDYDKLRQALTPRTKAVVPVDLAGVMCDYDRIFSILDEEKYLFKAKNPRQEAYGRVAVIADAAHALGATYKGKPSGSVADFTAFSFHAVKNLTTAEGGALTWRSLGASEDEALYHELQLLSLHGQSKDALAKVRLGAWEYDVVYPAYKCNMTDIMAALGLAQLKRYDQLLARRREIIKMYEEAFQDLPVTSIQHQGETYRSSGHLCLVRLDGYSEQQRNDFIVQMAEKGVSTNVHFKPLPLFTAYKNLGFSIDDYPNSFHQYENEVTLPLHTLLSDEDVHFIVDNMAAILGNTT